MCNTQHTIHTKAIVNTKLMSVWIMWYTYDYEFEFRSHIKKTHTPKSDKGHVRLTPVCSFLGIRQHFWRNKANEKGQIKWNWNAWMVFHSIIWQRLFQAMTWKILHKNLVTTILQNANMTNEWRKLSTSPEQHSSLYAAYYHMLSICIFQANGIEQLVV